MTSAQFHNTWLPLQGRFYRVAFYILENEADAKDAVQELYLKLWNLRGQLELVREPAAYGSLMMRNLCLDRIRKAKHLSFPSELPQTQFAPAPDETLDARTRLNKVLEAVKALPERQREVLILRTVEGLSYEEISARTGMNNLTCRVLLSQARTKIKTIV